MCFAENSPCPKLCFLAPSCRCYRKGRTADFEQIQDFGLSWHNKFSTQELQTLKQASALSEASCKVGLQHLRAACCCTAVTAQRTTRWRKPDLPPDTKWWGGLHASLLGPGQQGLSGHVPMLGAQNLDVLRGGKIKLIPRMPTLHLAAPVCPGSHLPLVLGGTWTTATHEKQLMSKDRLFQYLDVS